MNLNTKIDRLTQADRGVSPVIGVILMVAITVILAAVIGTFVLDLGQSAGQTAPSASLTVDANTNLNSLNVSHRGGDGLDAQRTRVVITNESNGESQTYEPTSNSDLFAVGGEVGFHLANSEVDTNTWGSMSADNDFNVDSGNQYTIEFIDTESQRVIFDTTVTV